MPAGRWQLADDYIAQETPGGCLGGAPSIRIDGDSRQNPGRTKNRTVKRYDFLSGAGPMRWSWVQYRIVPTSRRWISRRLLIRDRFKNSGLQMNIEKSREAGFLRGLSCLT